MIKGRVTNKKIVKWCNEQFEKLEIKNYEVFKVEATRFRGQDYEGGACKLYIRFRNKDLPNDHLLKNSCFYSFYSCSEIEEALRSGYRMYLGYQNLCNSHSLINLEIKLSKI